MGIKAVAKRLIKRSLPTPPAVAEQAVAPAEAASTGGKKRVFLHIGFHKTGTTALQDAFASTLR